MDRATRIALVLVLAELGCAHAGEPNLAEEVARLRQDNLAVRKRVQRLEQRFVELERLGSASKADPGLPGTRSLPVVKLEGPAPEVARQPPIRSSRSIPLEMPASPTAMMDERDSASELDAEQVSSGHASANRSYRLVGTRLVDLTKMRAVAPDRPARDRKGNQIIAEYEAARALYEGGRLGEAEAAFARFVTRHPTHDYADNALYWRGEAAYDLGHYANALAAFTEVVERYGGGNKAPDALLKVGLCYQRLGDVANARDVLTQLVSAYPEAGASNIARAKLVEPEGR